ncbi:class I adenylate-forming enzyme family protein [Pseudoalteromonas sp.]|uniref:class I adenylate-forming enzyme family protein n=1 Tax=Pseudoalteromonas sp. TaxID=53249 RepID=UPI0035648728
MSLFNLVKTTQAQLMAPGAPFEITQQQINGQSYQLYCNAPVNLAQVINDARRADEQIFLVYQQQRYSYKQFFQLVDNVASYLQQHGIKQGDRVAIAMRNRPEWVIAFCAIALIGAVPAPLNSFGMQQELHSALNTIAPKLLICDGPRWQRINQDNAWQGESLVLNDAAVDFTQSAAATDFSRALNQQAKPIEPPNINATDAALVLFTSGATSVAKAVESSHIAVCQALYNIDFISAISAMTSPQALALIMEKGLLPTILTAVPLFHVSGLHAQLLSALRGGRRLVFTHKWDPLEAIELIKKEQVTQFNGAPSMVMQLLREPSFHSDEVMASFSGLGFGGAGLPANLIDQALTSLPQQMIGIGFGMTETNGVGAAASGDLFRHQPKSSGLISPIMQVRICAADGQSLPTNSVGEVCMRGITIMDQYVGDPAATRDTIRAGWLHTGDLGYIDDAGFLFIVDRIKDVINRAGENIPAAEVESCLLDHSSVAEVAVFGIPDEETGEAVVAVVCPLDGEPVTEAELLAHVAQRLAKYKVPQKIHLMADKLPRNPAGKLLRNKLKTKLYQ